MLGDRTKTIIEPIRRLLRRGAYAQVRKIVNKTHAADLSLVFRTISAHDQKTLFSMIENLEQKGLLFSELDEGIFLRIIEGMDVDAIVEILDTMPSDDVADLMERFPSNLADEILQKMEKQGSEEVEGLLRYGNKTAGGIMVPDFFAVSEETTAGQAIDSLQKEHVDVEMPFYLYVTDDYGRLAGVSSLRQLVVVSHNTPIKDFMSTDVYRVSTDMDQEEVAKIVDKYDILAVPVVDEENKLVGIVTVDDVIDIIRAEATEDILKMAGVGDEFVENQSVAKSMRIRLPWLFAGCAGGVMASYIIGSYETTLKQMAYLAAFIPVVTGMGGNIGNQSATIVVRGLATGKIHIRDLWKIVGKELAVGAMLGIFYGLLVGTVAQISHGWPFALAVVMAIISSMSISTLIGAMFPLAFARFHIDPAVATVPFVSTTIDMLSVFFYLQIATMLINL